MKKLVLMFVSAVCLLGGSTIASAQGKYGADSAECIKYLSYYKEYFKQKNYNEALPNWRKAYTLCPPTANQTMLVDGTSLMRQLIMKNASNAVYKAALVDTLLTLHDLRAQYYPKYAQTALNNKALDMIQYMKDDSRALYDGLGEVIEANKTATRPQSFVFLMNSAVDLYNKGVLNAEQVISDYESSMEYMEGIENSLRAEGKSTEEVTKMKEDIENLFIASKVADCDELIALFGPRFQANPDSLQLAANIVRMMSVTEGCTDNEVFVGAAEAMHRLDPSASSAYFLYRIYSVKGDIDNASKYILESIESPDTDTEIDADRYFELATLCYRNSRPSDAYRYALRAAENDADNSIKGKVYLLIGTIWGSTSCKGNEIESRAPYWVAVDYMSRAKATDPSLAEECDRYISQYRSYYPQTAEAFMYDVTDGQTYTVSCNGMTATTTVRTQQ